jgi:hypothetical protein
MAMATAGVQAMVRETAGVRAVLAQVLAQA